MQILNKYPVEKNPLYAYINQNSALGFDIPDVSMYGMLKISAKKSYKSKIREYMNPLVILSYGLFFGCTLITMLAYRKVPLSMGQILESSGYIFVTILGTTILKEKLSRKKMIGMAVILLGIFVFTL